MHASLIVEALRSRNGRRIGGRPSTYRIVTTQTSIDNTITRAIDLSTARAIVNAPKFKVRDNVLLDKPFNASIDNLCAAGRFKLPHAACYVESDASHIADRPGNEDVPRMDVAYMFFRFGDRANGSFVPGASRDVPAHMTDDDIGAVMFVFNHDAKTIGTEYVVGRYTPVRDVIEVDTMYRITVPRRTTGPGILHAVQFPYGWRDPEVCDNFLSMFSTSAYNTLAGWATLLMTRGVEVNTVLAQYDSVNKCEVAEHHILHIPDAFKTDIMRDGAVFGVRLNMTSGTVTNNDDAPRWTRPTLVAQDVGDA